jgi:TIR domain
MNPLFNKSSIFSVVLYQKDQLKETFSTVSNAELDANTPGVVARLVDQFGINVPVLDEAKKFARTRETQVDVSRDPRRFIRDRSRAFYVAGTEVTFVVPFTGDAALFDVQPTSFNLNPPFGEVHGNELHLIYTLTDSTFNVESEAERNIAQIRQYLESMRPSAEQLKRELELLVASLVEQRKRERGDRAQIISGLKTPIQQEPSPVPLTSPAPVYPPARRRAGRQKRPDEWDVFISHATEDKDAIAQPLAEALRAKGLRVWYDDFSLTLGDSLRQSIDRGLAGSLFGVVILSPYFFEKHWPQQELNGLATREVEGEKVILPVWHDIGAEAVRENSPMLADRKAVRTSQGLDVVVRMIMEVVRPRTSGPA